MTTTPTPRELTHLTVDGETWHVIGKPHGPPSSGETFKRGELLVKRARDGRIRTFDAGGE